MARWFGPKRIGYGIGPRGWQGWLATAVFVAMFIGLARFRPENFGLAHWLKPALLGVVLVAYLVVAYLKYEPD
ncbi:MAG: hypothetical protein ACYCZX_08620 [Rhodospirillaceae bacterium]